MPFDPTIKRTEGTLRGPDGKTFKATKGAPHIILKLVEVDQEEVAKRVNWKVRYCAAGRRGWLLCALLLDLVPFMLLMYAVYWHFSDGSICETAKRLWVED